MTETATAAYVSYKELGFVNTRDMFDRAMKGGYAVPAYNFNNMEQLQAVITACVASRSPVILQVSKGAREYANATLLRWMGRGAVEMMKELGKPVPVALHLDHGDSFELCKSCIDNGFSSVMIDASAKPYEENVALTRKVVEYAHPHEVTVEGELGVLAGIEVVEYAHPREVTVEGELGVLAGIEDHVSAEKSHYTDPKDVEDFVKRTGADSLAISIGTSHGAYKFKLKPGESVPPLRFDILEEVERRIPGFPIVLHGASSVLQDYIAMINRYGGKMEGAAGIPEESLRRAAKSAVCKINIDSDGRLVMTAVIRKVFAEKPGEFDPRKYIGPAREALVKMYMEKNEKVLGSAGRA
ncbi:MAG: class II fructose-bisphosphate aldolase [Elusimicrobia bacterium]|nr:class II fructose-bisphosphate aldolase [Elusimicrobiota bacterium]